MKLNTALADPATPSHHGITVMGDACVLAGGQAAAAASVNKDRPVAAGV
jgi:hypothetical protein